MDITSINLEQEYKHGINNLFFFNNGDLIKLVRESTSRQHKFKPCPATG
tara:strand:+ start:1546 stop:1692 length:147 start_codon:yes stop_codon:yes gene_type:complete